MAITRKKQQKREKAQFHGKSADQTATVGTNPRDRLRGVVIFSLGLIFWYLNYRHVTFMFESDRHFSHLADFEREMTYRTEMGLYYSYYKTLINSPTFLGGLKEITEDNLTEYGHTINTLKRFNLYPEVFLALKYRKFKDLAKYYGWKTEQCWRVERGDLPPVESCEGIGNAHYFYVNHAFALASSVAASLFWIGVLVSDSLMGGLLSVCAFFFNHGEATRVQWTPPLRESFGYPVFLFQMLIVSYILKHGKSGISWAVLVALPTLLFMLFWQFAQFALATQLGALFLLYIAGMLPMRHLKPLLIGHMLSLASAFVLLFGNRMLLTSIYCSLLVAILLILLLNRLILVKLRLAIIVLIDIFALFALTFSIKQMTARLLRIQDDAHIIEILKAKFTDFANFHTRLYTCAPEFDFLGYEPLWKLTRTVLLPSAITGCFILFIYFVRKMKLSLCWRTIEKSRETVVVQPFLALAYNAIQLICFSLMAVLIMRLKLFWTPHLCVVTAFLSNKSLIDSALRPLNRYMTPIVHLSILVAILSSMSYQGYQNLQSQWKIRGEYSNPSQEALFEWINKETPKNAVFAGTMPVMANVKLSTNRPIVNHPHYEDAGLRNRTMRVYSVYSRKSIESVHQTLCDMGVNYLVFEYGWCSRENDQKTKQCSYPAIWDLVDEENRGKKALCDTINEAGGEQVGPFQIVYNQQGYKVLKVH